jgi:hypothetical protein
MDTVSKAHFSRMCGVSRTAISKAASTGIIGMHDDKVNLHHRLTKEYLKDKSQPVEVVDGKPKQKKRTLPAKKPPPTEITAPEAKDGDPTLMVVRSLDDINETNLLYLEKKDLDKFKVYEQALETRLKREERRGLLIPRIRVRQVFAKLYTIDVNQIKTMEDRLVPEICGAFGMGDSGPEAVAVRKMINDDTAKFLRQVKRLFDDFLKEVKTDKI